MTKSKHCNECCEDPLEQLVYIKFKYRKTCDFQEGNLIRLTPPAYGDGINTPAGSGRPSARLISNLIFDQKHSIPNSKRASNMFWLWGQFVDHAITLVKDGDSESFDIPVPTGDPHFDPQSTGTKVIPFHRSQFNPTTGTSTSNPRLQINSLTPFLDADSVYGVDCKRNHYIRLYKDGLLKTSANDMMPITDFSLDNAMKHISLFLGGDVRANEHLGLIAMHCLWVREHNHWAKVIKELNCHLCDEEIYQRARIMVEAEIQHITFNEFLPLLLGKPLPCYQGYCSHIDPQVSNEFSTAAYRLGHSLLSSKIYGKYKLRLKDTYFVPHMLCNSYKGLDIDKILKLFSESLAQELDAKVIDDVRNFLFGQPGQGGLDLVSLNIQRGRDHGLPDYETIRQALGTPDALSQESKDLLINVYGNLNDVDLWAGGLLEEPKHCSMLGPLFHKIVKEQFEKIRDGDKFWYENRLPCALLNTVKETKLSDILKRNCGVDHIHEYVMIVPHKHHCC